MLKGVTGKNLFGSSCVSSTKYGGKGTFLRHSCPQPKTKARRRCSIPLQTSFCILWKGQADCLALCVTSLAKSLPNVTRAIKWTYVMLQAFEHTAYKLFLQMDCKIQFLLSFVNVFVNACFWLVLRQFGASINVTCCNVIIMVNVCKVLVRICNVQRKSIQYRKCSVLIKSCCFTQLWSLPVHCRACEMATVYL